MRVASPEAGCLFSNTRRLQALSYLAAIINLAPTQQPRNYPGSTTTTPGLTNNAGGLGAYTILTECLAMPATRKASAKLTQMTLPQKRRFSRSHKDNIVMIQS